MHFTPNQLYMYTHIHRNKLYVNCVRDYLLYICAVLPLFGMNYNAATTTATNFEYDMTSCNK